MKITKIKNTHFYHFDVEYASQDKEFKSIPIGYIDKTVCGCGLTTVALENKDDIILTVPNTSLITNKIAQYPNKRCAYIPFKVDGDTTIEDVDNYIQTLKGPIKLMVTYDSLWKCEKYFNICKLIIDESDRLVANSNLKLKGKKATSIDINSYLLTMAEIYKDSTSFISATPIPLKYMPKFVSEMPQIKMLWKNTTFVHPIILERNNVISALKEELIKPLLTNKSITIGSATFDSVIIFINSIKNILQVINDLELNESDVAILCSNNSRNDIKIRGYNTPGKILPKFTFITSSGFQGIDLYSPTAISVVISSTNKDHQMINATLDLKQCISRNRDKSNPNYNKYIFIYNQSVFDKTEAELMQIIENTKIRIKHNTSTLNDYYNKDERYNATLESFSDSETFCKYSLFKEESWELNDFAFNADAFFILETKKQYTKGFQIIGELQGAASPTIIKKPIYTKSLSYSSLLIKYKLHLKNEYIFTKEELNYPNYILIDTYYTKFKSLTSNSKYCKERLEGDKQIESQIIKRIKSAFMKNVNYKLSYIKFRLNEIYKDCDINRVAKATDLNEYFSDVQFKKIKSERMVIIR